MKRDLGYQDNAVNPSSDGKRDLTPEEQDKLESVRRVLDSPGYRELHKIMGEVVQEATLQLCSMQNSLDVIRYNQGMIAAVQAVQHRFLRLGKEESYK